MTATREKARDKVVVRAQTWAARRRTAQVAGKDVKAREVGLYEKSGQELAEAVEKFNQVGEH